MPYPRSPWAQQSDLDCLSIGYVLANATNSGLPSPSASRLVRVYLSRLRGSDPSRDWLRMIIPDSEMSYGWFLSRLRDCQRPLRPAPFRPAPTQSRAAAAISRNLSLQVDSGSVEIAPSRASGSGLISPGMTPLRQQAAIIAVGFASILSGAGLLLANLPCGQRAYHRRLCGACARLRHTALIPTGG